MASQLDEAVVLFGKDDKGDLGIAGYTFTLGLPDGTAVGPVTLKQVQVWIAANSALANCNTSACITDCILQASICQSPVGSADPHVQMPACKGQYGSRLLAVCDTNWRAHSRFSFCVQLQVRRFNTDLAKLICGPNTASLTAVTAAGNVDVVIQLSYVDKPKALPLQLTNGQLVAPDAVLRYERRRFCIA